MRKSIVITDVTRMYGSNVCIAGYTGYPSSLECVRPMFRSGSISEDWLHDSGKAIIQPFAEVELEFKERAPVTPPHIEDYIVDSAILPLRKCLFSSQQKLTLLQRLNDGFVTWIFGALRLTMCGYLCDICKAEIAVLQQEVGQLTIEQDWLKKI